MALILASIGITLCSGLALALVAVSDGRRRISAARGNPRLDRDPDPAPGAIVGSAVSLATGRWWPFFVGLVLTCLPTVLAIALAEPVPGFEAGMD